MAVIKARCVWWRAGQTIESNYWFDTSLIDLDVIKQELLRCDNWDQFDKMIAKNVKINWMSERVLDYITISVKQPDPTLTALTQSITSKIVWGGDKCIIWRNPFFSVLRRMLSYGYFARQNHPNSFCGFKEKIEKLSTTTEILTGQDDLLLSLFKESYEFKSLYYQLQLNKQNIALKNFAKIKRILKTHTLTTPWLTIKVNLFNWFKPLLKRKWQQQFLDQWLFDELTKVNLTIDDFNKHLERVEIEKRESEKVEGEKLNYPLIPDGLFVDEDENGELFINF